MFDASAIGLERRDLFVAHALAQIEINQLAEGQRFAIFLARRRGIASAATSARRRFASARALSGVQGDPCLPIVSRRFGERRPEPAR
jgi:hypothetical protein